jgi:hypothetical protein
LSQFKDRIKVSAYRELSAPSMTPEVLDLVLTVVEQGEHLTRDHVQWLKSGITPLDLSWVKPSNGGPRGYRYFPQGHQATASAAASADNDRAADQEPASGSAAEPADASPDSSADASDSSADASDSSADASPDEADTGPDTHRTHARQGNGAATGTDAKLLRSLQHVLRFCQTTAAELAGEAMTTLVNFQGALSDAQRIAVTKALSELVTRAADARSDWVNGGKVTHNNRKRTFSKEDDVLRKLYRQWAEESGFVVIDRNNRPDFGKLAKLLGMLGSNHDGELLNAARAIEQERKRQGLTWAEILGCEADAEAAV